MYYTYNKYIMNEYKYYRCKVIKITKNVIKSWIINIEYKYFEGNSIISS